MQAIVEFAANTTLPKRTRDEVGGDPKIATIESGDSGSQEPIKLEKS